MSKIGDAITTGGKKVGEGISSTKNWLDNGGMTSAKTWVEKILADVKNILSTKVRPPFQKYVPTILAICEAKRKPGLSAIALTSAVISRLHEAGIITTPNADGSLNKVCGFVKIFSEEIINEMKNSKIDLFIDIGKVLLEGMGANAGGPVTVISTNKSIITGDGSLN